MEVEYWMSQKNRNKEEGDYLSLPETDDWKFGGKDFMIEWWEKYSKWCIWRLRLIRIYYHYVIYNKWRILRYFKLCKISYDEYLDIRSFKKHKEEQK